MHLTLGVKTDETTFYKFPIAIDQLVSVVKDSYLGLGTAYDPILIDDFVTQTRTKSPEIDQQTTLSLQLVYENEHPEYPDLQPAILCCKIRNVGRSFNDDQLVPEMRWEDIFVFDKKRLLATPDGYLYVSPNKDNVCILTTKTVLDITYLAYSIILAMTITDMNGIKRRYYFIIDPVVRIRSNPPK